MKSKDYPDGYILGLDLGVASVGWAILPLDSYKLSIETLKMGVRIFDAGINKFDTPNEASRNADRRSARGIRRGFWRTRRRMVKLFNILQQAGLLPVCLSTPERRQDMLNQLDKDLMERYFFNATRIETQTFIYQLRTFALDKQLDLFAIGRIIYALGQRRGFLSNKKLKGLDKDKDKEQGKVITAITELDKNIEESGARTLGEYFANLDPEKTRIRTHWVGRKNYIDEFEAIWKSQARFYPELLTSSLRERIFKVIFAQRPLKSQRFLIGKCDLEKNQRVIRRSDPLFQEFRYWHDLLNLRVVDPIEGVRALTPEELDILVPELEKVEKIPYKKIRNLLGFKIPKEAEKTDSKIYRFTKEFENDETALMGNKTRAKIIEKLKKTGASIPSTEIIDSIYREIIFYDKAEALVKKLNKLFPTFTEETIQALAGLQFEPDYGNLSRRAIKKLLPLMKQEYIPYSTARQHLYGDERLEEAKINMVDLLNPVEKTLGDLRNPNVMRTLTEMRKVVNAIIQRWGKPTYIRVELARDMKRGKEERKKIHNSNKERESERESFRQELIKKGVLDPKERDILKYRLYKECGGRCPYTGKEITIPMLFNESQIDIEHIIPFSLSLDDTFANKTLCFAEENRNVKRRMTPFQAYAHKPQWGEILTRVRAFQGSEAKRKLEKFLQTEVDAEEAQTRLLNDTRYISKVALNYLGTLYGAVDGKDPQHIQRIQVTTGGMTGLLRRVWGLNSILASDEEESAPKQQKKKHNGKNRNDHRHHAIDAVVIALTDQKMLQELSRCAEETSEGGSPQIIKAFRTPNGNKDLFISIVDNVTQKINVSRRINRKISGKIHEETNYGAKTGEKGPQWRVIRKPLTSLSPSKAQEDIDKIVDPVVRRLVQEKFEENGRDVKKFELNPPVMPVSDNTREAIPINKVRFWKNVKAFPVGKIVRYQRWVAPGNNHHMEVFAILNNKGNEIRYKARVVSLFEAIRRKRMKESIIQRDFGPNTKFMFSLSIDENVIMNDGKIYTVRGISEEKNGSQKMECQSQMESRKNKTVAHSPGTFLKKGIRKVYIDLLGNVHPAND